MSTGSRNILLTAVFALLALLGARYLLPVLMPFLLGTGLALLAEPAVQLFTRRFRMNRAISAGIGVSGAFALICLVLMVVLTLLLRELGLLAGILPDMELTIRQGLEVLRSYLADAAGHSPESLRPVLERNVNELFSGGTALLDRATRYALGLAGTLLGHLPDSTLGLGTALLSAFLISARLPRLRERLAGLLQRWHLQGILTALRAFRTTALHWLTAQLKLAGVTCLVLLAGFALLRIPYAPVWALGVSVVDAFPILGTGTVLLPWSLICLVQHDTPRALGLLGVYAVVSLVRSTLEPRIIGRELGLDPLVTLVALYTGFRLWGLAGMLLAPMFAMTALEMAQQ